MTIKNIKVTNESEELRTKVIKPDDDLMVLLEKARLIIQQ